jgi:hypothetical protein
MQADEPVRSCIGRIAQGWRVQDGPAFSFTFEREQIVMSQRYLETTALRRAARVGVIALGLCLAGANAGAAGGVDPEADRILKSMASYLGKLPVF